MHAGWHHELGDVAVASHLGRERACLFRPPLWYTTSADSNGSLRMDKLRRVSEGESIVVTDHGRPVARLVPPDVLESLSRLIRAGRLNWAGRRMRVPRKRPVLRGGGPSVSEIVLRDRG